MSLKVEIAGLADFTEALNRLASALETSPTPGPTPDPQAEPITEKEQPETTVSLDQVREKFVTLAQAGKKQHLKELLDEYGADNVSSLDEDVLGEVFARLDDM